MATGVIYTTYFYGDSFTLGVGATTYANRWASLVTANKIWESDINTNLGNAGQSISPDGIGGNNFNLANLVLKGRYNKRLVVSWGINDCNTAIFPTGTVNDFITAYTNFFTQCTTNGWGRSEIIVISQYLIASWGMAGHPNYDAYASALETLCTSLGIQWINCKAYMSANGGDALFIVGGGNDGHPNDTGNAVIATYIQSQI